MKIQQLSIFVENKCGRLQEITQALEEEKINIRAMSVADTSDFGILRLIVDNPEKAVDSFRSHGMTLSLTSVIGIGISDEPGAFARAVKILSEANIGIEYLYDYNSRQIGKACIILRVDDEDRAIEVLEKNGIKMLTAKDVYNV
ncbi:MAG TPA: acetolactate synthase [Clostridiales bacterium]|nr:acetolactate synthase [Clostridiales bacterium]